MPTPLKRPPLTPTSAPLPLRRTVTPVTPQEEPFKLRFGSPQKVQGQKFVVYGTGGVGKTTLSCSCPGQLAYLDLDESLSLLKDFKADFDSERIKTVSVSNWIELRQALQSKGWEGIDTIVIDSLSVAEQWATAWTLDNVKSDKGMQYKNIEDYGYGKGYSYVFDTFNNLFVDLDAHIRAGRNIILVCHECTTTVPNPEGNDFLRYEPRLQSPTSGKASIRHRLKEWTDHVFFVQFDKDTSKDGKATGGFTRTAYTCDQIWAMAKSRSTTLPIYLEDPTAFWNTFLQ